MIRKIDSNIFSLTILKVTTFSRIRHIKVGSDYLLGFGNYNVILENCTELSAIFVKNCTELSALSLFIRIFAAKEQHNRA